MLSTKAKLLVVAMFLVAVLLTGQARLSLDDIVAPFRDNFSEMDYLPRGNELKIVACGFEAPLADALFIKAMIYFGESFYAHDNLEKRRDYTYSLFDVITDLSPRFTRAYQTGGLFLSSSQSLKSNMDGVAILEKGVANYDRFEKEGKPVAIDARWLFHTLLANIYEVNIQAHRRSSGDSPGANEARQRAAREFRLASLSPNAPEYVRTAAVGYESALTGEGNIENSLIAVLMVWQELYTDAVNRNEKELAASLEGRVAELKDQIDNIRKTRAIEEQLTAAGRKYLTAHGSAPAGADDLLADKLIPGLPTTPLQQEGSPEYYIALPDGSFRSKTLSDMETLNQLNLLNNAAIVYNRSFNHPPESPQKLIDEQLLTTIPEPPLKALGQTYSYDPNTGVFADELSQPLGPVLGPVQLPNRSQP